MDVTQMYISEFVGTAVLIAFGNSTNASILLKKTTPHNSSSISSNLGIGWRYFTVILLIARQSTYMRIVPSFFGTKKKNK